MQLLNVAFGGTLVQDLPTASAHRSQDDTGDQVHTVTVPRDSFLFGLYGDRFSVNSSHHQGAERIGEGFRIAARAIDGGIEAIQCPDAVDGKTLFAFFREPPNDGWELTANRSEVP